MRSFWRHQVSTCNSSQSTARHEYILYVKTADYTNECDVLRVEKRLRDLGVLTGKASYKPDIYAEIGIFHNNQWGICPTYCLSRGCEKSDD